MRSSLFLHPVFLLPVPRTVLYCNELYCAFIALPPTPYDCVALDHELQQTFRALNCFEGLAVYLGTHSLDFSGIVWSASYLQPRGHITQHNTAAQARPSIRSGMVALFSHSRAELDDDRRRRKNGKAFPSNIQTVKSWPPGIYIPTPSLHKSAHLYFLATNPLSKRPHPRLRLHQRRRTHHSIQRLHRQQP